MSVNVLSGLGEADKVSGRSREALKGESVATTYVRLGDEKTPP